jgi:hypothetical protein
VFGTVGRAGVADYIAVFDIGYRRSIDIYPVEGDIVTPGDDNPGFIG